MVGSGVGADVGVGVEGERKSEMEIELNAIGKARVKAREERESRLKEIRDTGRLPDEPTNEDLTEFYYAQSQKEGGGAYATAYALMQIYDVLHGNADQEGGELGIADYLWDIAEAAKAKNDPD